MRIARSLLLLSLAVIAGALVSPTVLDAQAGIEQIRQYDVSIEIEPDGDVLVVEDISYDFGPYERHGIYRDLQYRYGYDDQHERVIRIHDVRVSASQGTPADVDTSTDGYLFHIRIGDPDRTIRGIHQYRISYRVEGALNSFEDHEELFWNVASDWEVPISNLSVNVTAPAGFVELICFAGPTGSRASCGNSSVTAAVANAEQESLRAYEAFSIAVAMPPDSVEVPSPILDTLWSLDRAFARTPFTLGGMAALLLAAIGIVARLIWMHGRDRRFVGSAVEVAFGSPTGEVQTVPLFESHEDSAIEFGPPENMQPGLMGTLVDEVAHPLDITATVIDLAVRGYLTIEEIPKEGWFGKDDWSLKRLRETDDELVGYEQRLLDGLFQDGDEVLLSDLKTEFVSRLKQVQDDLYDETVDRGWYRRRPDQVRNSWIGIGVGAAAVGGLLTAALAIFTSFALLGLPVIFGGLLVAIRANAMPRRTAKGTGMMRRAMGFQRALATAEADNARWAEQQGIFSKYLPYAVVFGLTERWAKAFEGLDEEFTGTAGWYVSSYPFTTYAFASSIGDFSKSTAGTIVATPAASGSSGFGGGGFSGGGFGGGGGGSW
ncbi:MAG: DUF2207 domain-containing protein [Dehalococcoidia bacterium]|jgi:hypothetical protein|nr:DUF2207 domain-containing protein [Dehalococcoidia bacterium]